MKRLLFTQAHYEKIRTAFAVEPEIETSILIAGTRANDGANSRLLVREVLLSPPDAYSRRDAVSAILRSDYLGPVVRKRRTSNAFLGFIHNHPHQERPSFSSVDDAGERLLRPFLAAQLETDDNVSVVAGTMQWSARTIGDGKPVAVFSVGAELRQLSSPFANDIDHLRLDRQIRAFGQEGQLALSALKFAIVGLGGTGSIVAQELAYLGARSFQLIDPDAADLSNLNRLVGASAADVGRLKVDIASDHIRNIAPSCDVDTINGDILNASVAARLLENDIVFGCTDSHGSRAVLNQLAYQYLLPCIDIGVGIFAARAQITRMTGRVQMLSPGLGCLTCGNLLDAGEVRTDLMTPAERRRDPYFTGAHVEQPAVISLNATMSSLAVTMALAAISGVPAQARMQIYDGIAGTVRSAAIKPVGTCVVCSEAGALAQGRNWSLPVRPTSGHGI